MSSGRDIWNKQIIEYLESCDYVHEQIAAATGLLQRLILQGAILEEGHEPSFSVLTQTAEWLPKFTDAHLVRIWVETAVGMLDETDWVGNRNVFRWNYGKWYWYILLSDDENDAIDEAAWLCKAIYDFDHGAGPIRISICIDYDHVPMLVEQLRTADAIDSVAYELLDNRDEIDDFDYRGAVLLRERIEEKPLPGFLESFASVVTTCANEQQPDVSDCLMN